MTFTVEDGTVVSGANAIATVAEGDNYYAMHLHGFPWTSSNEQRKQAAIVTSTRLVLNSFRWKGTQTNPSQPLAWPRIGVGISSDYPRPPYANAESRVTTGAWEVPSNVIPERLKWAVLEMCRYLLVEDRETKKDTRGLKRQKVDVLEREFFDDRESDVIPESVQRLVSDFIIAGPKGSAAVAGHSFGGRS